VNGLYGSILQSETLKYADNIGIEYIQKLKEIDIQTPKGTKEINEYLTNEYSKFKKIVDNDKMIAEMLKNTAKSRFILDLIARFAEFYDLSIEEFMYRVGEPTQKLFAEAANLLD